MDAKAILKVTKAWEPSHLVASFWVWGIKFPLTNPTSVYTKNSNTHCTRCIEILLMLLSVHVTSVLILVWFNNFDLASLRVTRSYSSCPFLCALDTYIYTLANNFMTFSTLKNWGWFNPKKVWIHPGPAGGLPPLQGFSVTPLVQVF